MYVKIILRLLMQFYYNRKMNERSFIFSQKTRTKKIFLIQGIKQLKCPMMIRIKICVFAKQELLYFLYRNIEEYYTLRYGIQR